MLLAYSTTENVGLILTAVAVAVLLNGAGQPGIADVALTAALLLVVSHAAFKLQELGMISYARGLIRVLDRPKLETLSCECYEVVKKETDLLLHYMPQRQIIKDVESIPTATLQAPA